MLDKCLSNIIVELFKLPRLSFKTDLPKTAQILYISDPMFFYHRYMYVLGIFLSMCGYNWSNNFVTHY